MVKYVKLMTILQRWGEGKRPQREELELLGTSEGVFAIGAENGLEGIERRANLWRSVYPDLLQLCQKLGLGKSELILTTSWHFWLPLGLQLAHCKEKLGRTLIQGILGGQGTGKTTLAAATKLILKHLGYSSIGISLDDLYKTYNDRKRLQKQDPRLIWRGPPGTHDVELGVQLLEQLRQGTSRVEPIFLPRFDKSAYNGAGERTEPEEINHQVDIVLFEGWFVGVRPLDEKAFDMAPPPIITAEDRLFAQDTNERLKEYLPLWELLDRLMVLYPVDYRLSKQWRKEAEQKAIASGKSGMTDTEIERFVEYFWRCLHPELFITPLISNPSLVNLVVEIQPDRSIGNMYSP